MRVKAGFSFVGILFLPLLAMLAATVAHAQDLPGAAQQRWTTYVNERFGFSVDVPTKGLVALEPPVNGDGQAWEAADGDVLIIAFGSHWSASSDSFSAYKALSRSFLISNNASVTYEAEKGDWFVHSGYLEDGRIYYDKAVALPDCDIAAHIHLVYPTALKSEMGGIVQRMADSLGPSVAMC